MTEIFFTGGKTELRNLTLKTNQYSQQPPLGQYKEHSLWVNMKNIPFGLIWRTIPLGRSDVLLYVLQLYTARLKCNNHMIPTVRYHRSFCRTLSYSGDTTAIHISRHNFFVFVSSLGVGTILSQSLTWEVSSAHPFLLLLLLVCLDVDWQRKLDFLFFLLLFILLDSFICHEENSIWSDADIELHSDCLSQTHTLYLYLTNPLYLILSTNICVLVSFFLFSSPSLAFSLSHYLPISSFTFLFSLILSIYPSIVRKNKLKKNGTHSI